MTDRKPLITTQEIRDIREEVKRNARKLDQCVGPHDFPDPTPDGFMSRKTCSKCGGTLGAVEAIWYKRGLQHGSKVP